MMYLKVLVMLVLFAFISSFSVKVSNTPKTEHFPSIEVSNHDMLLTILQQSDDNFYKMLHRQVRKDTLYGNEIADSLANRTAKYRSGSHYCYRAGKKPTSDIMDIQLTGMSAYMAADQHANAIDSTSGWPYYVELTDPENTFFNDNEKILGIKGLNRLYMEQPWNYDVKRALKKELQESLPKGVIMVWDRLKPGRGKTWVNNGHFGITIGMGKERSWKTMDIAVFPTKLRLFIPNHTSHEQKYDPAIDPLAQDIVKYARVNSADIDNVKVTSLF